MCIRDSGYSGLFRQPLARFVVAAQKVSQMGALRHIEQVMVVAAVSYTHLDVYKRQAQFPFRLRIKGLRCGQAFLLPPAGAEGPARQGIHQPGGHTNRRT